LTKKKLDFNPFEPLREKFIQLQRMKLGEIPLNILNTMDVLYKDKEHKPLLIKSKEDGKVGIRQYSSGWHFVFTLNPGCDYKEIESKISYFKSVVSGKVEMELKDKYLHINVSDFKWEKSYPFSLITQKEVDKCKKMYLPIPLGIIPGGENGKLIFVNMEDFSHLMTGGVNNSGKSTWIRQLIMFLKKYRPEVKIVYIDFMRLDARPFKDIVYLGRNIQEAHFLLQLTCMEVDRRLDILEKAKCFKASEYKGKEPMNPVLVIIDELAEFEDKDSQHMINHLARTARKCGVHLIISLQRPSHTTYKNFTDSRSQFPARLCFKMSSKIDSEIVLSNSKAYEISGNAKGRAIWQYDKEIEVQSLFIDNHELLNMISELKNEKESVIYEQQQNLWLQP
jgi:S-DNA-T family DNA segregation ATPase FtsK/SpoIIIE